MNTQSSEKSQVIYVIDLKNHHKNYTEIKPFNVHSKIRPFTTLTLFTAQNNNEITSGTRVTSRSFATKNANKLTIPYLIAHLRPI